MRFLNWLGDQFLKLVGFNWNDYQERLDSRDRQMLRAVNGNIVVVCRPGQTVYRDLRLERLWQEICDAEGREYHALNYQIRESEYVDAE